MFDKRQVSRATCDKYNIRDDLCWFQIDRRHGQKINLVVVVVRMSFSSSNFRYKRVFSSQNIFFFVLFYIVTGRTQSHQTTDSAVGIGRCFYFSHEYIWIKKLLATNHSFVSHQVRCLFDFMKP
jgi:hypothetical protein